jgi:uncharacterized protein with PQ loop repeat
VNYKNFIEYQNWGWNIITLSFIGTVIFSIIEGWGIWQQRNTINEKNSSQSLPMMANAYYCIFFICFLIYGIQMKSLAMIINGLLAIPFIAMYISALKTPDNEGVRKWHLSFLVLIPLVLFSTYSKEIFGTMILVACLIGTQTPIEILRNKDSGSVEPKFLWSLTISVGFWTIYAWCINDKAVFIANAYSFLMLSYSIYIWHIYSPKAKARYCEELKEVEKELLKEEIPLSQDQLDEFGQVEELNLEMGGSEIGLCPSIKEYLKRRRTILLRRIGRLPYTPTPGN